MTKIALIPNGEIPESERRGPDLQGELEVEDSGPGDDAGFVTVDVSPPVTIDLRHLPGATVATLLNTIDNVPAGTYGKIRLYYDNVVGRSGGVDTVFHQTAHYHLDIHFMDGKFVVPVGTDPSGGISFFEVVINVVGLKIQRTGSGILLLRPQVFATVEAPKFLVIGVAANVVKDLAAGAGTFDILTSGGETIHSSFGPTTSWEYVDNLVVPERRVSNPSPPAVIGPAGLNDTALVEVVGLFSPSKVLVAERVSITFPKTLSGRVYLGWNPDNTFTLRLATDNTVHPRPDRATAYYDNAVSFAQLTDASIVDNVAVTARGYAVLGGVDAYWISVGGP